MMKVRGLFWKVFLLAMLATFVVALVVSRLYPPPVIATKAVTNEKTPALPVHWPLSGTGSCSARGCHGGIEPVLDLALCRQNEYAEWAHDRHADAYRTLFSERSQQMVKLLGGPAKAHEDSRCLACHTNPQLATLPGDEAFVQEERRFGVGCESCHGSANQWLVAHTARDWRARKHKYAMPDLSDPTVQAKACVGCHVGALPDKDTPLRDVNHDLIAAGHPRLTFEFGAYQANMPSHWRPKKKSAGQLWAVGQLASAQAALDLLAHRAKEGPWPEFAEYDCFACHHSLAAPRADRRKGKPGVPRWGSWYYALTRDLAGDLPALDALDKQMQVPFADRTHTVGKAKAASAELKKLHPFSGDKSAMLARQRIVDRFQSGALSIEPSWDGAEQMYLAYHALNPSPALNDLASERAFAPGFDGPLAWPRNGALVFRPGRFLEKLKGLSPAEK